MISWMTRLTKISAECSRLQSRVASLEDDLADALSRFAASEARERQALENLDVAEIRLQQAQHALSTYRLAVRGYFAAGRRNAGGHDMDDLIRDTELGL